MACDGNYILVVYVDVITCSYRLFDGGFLIAVGRRDQNICAQKNALRLILLDA